MSRLQILQLLLSLGPKLTEAWPHLLAISDLEQKAYAEAQQVATILGVQLPVLAGGPASQEEHAIADQIRALLPQHQAALGGGWIAILMQIAQALKDNPWLLELIKQFLSQKPGPSPVPQIV